MFARRIVGNLTGIARATTGRCERGRKFIETCRNAERLEADQKSMERYFMAHLLWRAIHTPVVIVHDPVLLTEGFTRLIRVICDEKFGSGRKASVGDKWLSDAVGLVAFGAEPINFYVESGVVLKGLGCEKRQGTGSTFWTRLWRTRALAVARVWGAQSHQGF